MPRLGIYLMKPPKCQASSESLCVRDNVRGSAADANCEYPNADCEYPVKVSERDRTVAVREAARTSRRKHLSTAATASDWRAPQHRHPRRPSFGVLASLAIVLLGIAGLASSILPVSGKAAASGSPGWLVSCTTVHSRADDPIVHPGMAGMSHMHDFIGNPTTTATSTYTSMTAATTSGCALPADKAGYWVPALYRNGVKIAPSGTGLREQIYYRDNDLKVGTKIEPFPADFRMITGNAMATSVADSPKLGKEIYWGCSDNSESGKPIAPVNCATGIISLHVGFPNCWDGVLTHSNDTAHVRWPSSGVCPAGYTHALPRVIERWEYRVGTSSSGITLASGPTYTAHADFWNSWNQTRLNSLVANCLNADVDCGKPTS
jgi:hypothetical protein